MEFTNFVDVIKFAIARGAYAPNEKLPSVRSLARSLLVNPNTVIRVYRELEQAGLLYARRGKGVFVAPRARRRCKRERVSIVEDKLGEALDLARRANLDDLELEEIWRRLRAGTGEGGADELAGR